MGCNPRADDLFNCDDLVCDASNPSLCQPNMMRKRVIYTQQLTSEKQQLLCGVCSSGGNVDNSSIFLEVGL